jgi:chloramphenicol-sensitive protein RarD
MRQADCFSKPRHVIVAPTMSQTTTTPPAQAGAAITRDPAGVGYAVAAYTIWGGYALFFAWLAHVNALEVIAHRAFWSIPVAGAVMLWMGRTQDLRRVMRSPKLFAIMCLSTLMVTLSWGFFVWGVAQGRALEVALGYYINPLLNVAVGYLVLRERMTPLQFVAIILAVIAVAWQTFSIGVFPWLSLLLGSAFCAYGYIRRTVDVGPVQGFFVESVILSVISLGIVWWLSQLGPLAFGSDTSTTVLLIISGMMTALPLMFFATAARRISFTLLGLLQYIAPSLHFLTAVFILHEPLRTEQLVTFALIWTALALYTISSLRLRHKDGG